MVHKIMVHFTIQGILAVIKISISVYFIIVPSVFAPAPDSLCQFPLLRIALEAGLQDITDADAALVLHRTAGRFAVAFTATHLISGFYQ